MKSAASPFHRLGIFLLLIGLFAPLVPPEAAAQDEEPAATGALQIWVTGSDGLALSGASFQIVDAAGATFTTASSNGLATASGLAEGWATVVQTGAAGAYHVATGSLGATIVGGATVDLSVINTAPPPPDADSDGIPDSQDRTPYGESDSDDIPDDADNCPSITNPGQEDADGDGIGDACDETPFPVVDSDGDGIPDDQDSTPHGESDADDIPDDLDNCPTADNPGQEDADGDGIGDACAEPGDSAAAEDDVGFGIMAVGVWLDVFVAHPGDSPTYSIFAKPGDVIEVHVIADNLLGEEAETVTITGTVPSQITITSISSNLPCTSALPTSGNTASCTATVAAGSTLDMVFTGTVNATQTETDCVAGLAPTGVMSPAGYDNQAQIDLDCPISTVPVAPTFAAGTCVNSTFTPAMVTETPTPGVIYTYDPPLDKVLVHGGLVSIFANLQSGYSWGDFASPWLVTPGSPGVLHLPPGFVTVPSCITAVAEVSNDGGTTYHSAVSAGPGDELSLAMTITNIGGDFIVNGLISGDRLPSFVELTSPTIGCSLPPTPEGPSLLCVLSSNLNHDESKTFSVTARIATTLSEGDCAAGFDWRVVPNNGGGAETFNGPASTAHISFDCPEQLAPQLPTITTPASCVNGVFTAPVITPDTTPGITYEYTPSLEVLAASGGQTTVRATKSDRDTWSVDETVWNVDGNTASATVDVTVPPCLTITKEVRTTVLNFSPGPVTVLANEIREFRITVTNTGSIATGYQVTDIIQAPLTMFSYTPSNPTCSYTIATATVTCSRTIDPGESQQLSIVVNTGQPTEVQCASGVDNAATLTQINGQTTTQASNTVHLAYNCAPVVPELATKTNGSCSSSGVYTAPTFIKKTTPGIIYTYSATEDGNTEIDPSSPEFLATGGEVYVFARLDAGAVWGSLDSQVWFEVLGEPGTYVSYFYVSASPCLAITKQVSTGEAYTNGPITVAPRGEADIRISVTNTGTTAVEYELTDTLAAPLGFVGGVSGCAIDGLTVTCDGTIEPGEIETFDFTIMVLDPSAAQCDTSVTNTASLAYLNEWGQNVAHTSNTVSFAIECEKVTPELPEIAGGSCVNGVYTVSFKEATTDGISYSYNRDINDFLATGGDLTITATLDSGKAWGTVDTATWTQVGAAYTATIPIVVPPCVSIELLVSADGGGTYHAEVEADPLTDVYYRVTIANTGNLAADVSFDLHLSPHVSLTAVFNLSVDCQTISLNPPIQSCSTREPLPASQSLVVTYQALIKGSLEPATCAAGLDGTASLTSLDGTPVAVQSTAHVDLTCAGPVTPELPTATDGSCVDGVYTALTFTPPSTDGITYSYDREIADFLATGGDLTVTAALEAGKTWGIVDATVWTAVGDTYEAKVDVEAPPCLAINVTIMKRGIHAYMWTVVVTNTGGPATDIQFSNTFPTAVSAIFDDANYERYSGVSCDSANAVGFSCTIASLSQGAATGVDITLTDTTASPLSASQCATGIDTVASITSVNGQPVSIPSNTAQLTFTCAHPELPTIVDGSCLNGDYTAPEIDEVDNGGGLTYSYQPSLDEIKATGGDLTITATIDFDHEWGPVSDDWTVSGNTATAIVPIVNPPCVSLDLLVSQGGGERTSTITVQPGTYFQIWATVRNHASDPANMTFILSWPPPSLFDGPEVACFPRLGNPLNCLTFAPLAAGESRLVWFGAGLRAPQSEAACAAGIDIDIDLTATNGGVEQKLDRSVHVTLDCSNQSVPGLPEVTPGSCIDGDYTAPRIIEDTTPGMSYSYQPSLDAIKTTGGDLTITADIESGYLWGVVDTNIWDQGTINYTTVVPIEAPPCLAFTKTITSGDGPYAPGDAVTYELVVTNTGPVALTGVTISDPLIADLACAVADAPVTQPVAIDSGVELTCTGSYTVVQNDIDAAEPLVNTATANSTETGTHASDATAILVAHQPGISLQKTVSPETITAPGSLAYTFRIENTGNVTLHDLTLTDPDLNLTSLDCDAGQDGAQPLPATLAPHAVVTCTTDVEVGQGQIDAGDPVVNTATVSARTPADATISSSSSATVTITQTPSLTLHKSASQTIVSAPQTITYTFSIQNMGNVTLTNLALIDPRIDLAQLDCGPADGVQPLPSTLAVGSDAITCTAPYTVSQAQIDARQPITNTAQVTSDQANSTESSTTITVVPTDGLSLVTSVTPTTVDAPGDVTFTFVIHNQGSASATGLALIDSLVDLDAVDCDPADDIQELPTTLAAGASVTCTVPYAIDQDMIDARQPIMNTAQVTSDQADSSQATTTVTIVPIDGLSLVKSVAPNTMDAPGTITYTLVIANNGSAAISGIELADPHIDLVAVDCDPATDGVQAIPATLAAGETVTCTVPYTVTQNQIDAGTAITNTARVTSDQADSNESSATVTIAQRPAVSLVKSVDLATVDAPGTVTYTFTIQNRGNVTLTSVALVDPLVDHALIDCDPDTDGAQGILDILAVGADAVTCTVPVAITQDDIDGGQPIASTAQAISSQTSSNEANATVTITQTPRLTLGKSVSPDTVTTPDEVTYTFTVQNTGNVTLTNVALIDPWVDAGLIDCDPADGVQRVPTTLAVGSDAVTCSVDHAISQDQIDARQPVVNMAHLTSDQVDSNEASATITVAPTDGLGLIMSVSPTMMSAPGAATFTIVIQNQGSASVTGVALTTSLVYHDLLDCDPAADDAQGVPSVLAAGASLTCTLPYDVTQDEIDAGAAIANTARVVSDQVESDEAGAMVSITQDPKLSLSKTVSPVTIDAPGDVTYTFTIQNTGNVTLTNVALVDPHKNLDLVDCDPADGIRGVPVTLPVGSDAVVCSAPYAVSQGQVDARLPIVNTARVTSDQVTSNSSTATITVVPVDGLGLVTSVAPQTVDAPGTVTFTFAITNGGTAEVTGLALVDPLVDLASVDCDPDTDGIQPLPATLAATAGVICTADYDVSQGQIDLGVTIVNSAHVTSDQVDSNAASATVTITQAPVLSLAKSVDQETINAPSEVTYTFTIQNTGNVTLTNITLVDPAIDLDLVDCDPATDGAQGVPGTLAVGSGTTICTVPFDIDQNDIDAGNAIVNTAQVTSDQVTSNTSTSTVTITQIPGLTLGKAVEPASVDAPRDVTYTFTVQNTGNVTLTNVALIDPHVDLHLVDCDPAMDGAQSPPTSLAVGSDAISCSVDYFVTQAQIDAGEAIANTARVVSDQVDSNEASATMAIVQAPELTLEKVVAPATIGASGSVTYTFTIQNTGNVTLAGLSLVDPHVDHALIDCDPADGVQGVPDTLAVGSEAIACTVDFLVTQAQIDARQPLINTAQVTSDQVNSNEASATITIVPTDSLGLAKSVDPDMVDAPGEVIFTFAIANGGGAVLSDVELIDDAIDLALVDCDPATNGVQSVPTTLAAGASVTCTAPYTITQADIDAGEAIVNTAQVTSDQADSNESTATITITQAPELTLAKAVAPAIVSEPGNVTYTFTIQNTGNVTLTNVALVDPAIDAEEVDCDLTMDGSQAPPSSLAVGSDPRFRTR